MVHGGPYPATSDARGTSVGTLAIDRYLRPVCYQNYPQSLLPEALRDENPLKLLRLVNGEMTEIQSKNDKRDLVGSPFFDSNPGEAQEFS